LSKGDRYIYVLVALVYVASLIVPHSRKDTKTVVKAAFEDCSDIKSYYDDGSQITGKTGARMGLITSSYGEEVVVEIPEDQSSSTESMVSITGKKEVDANIGADPDKYVNQVQQSINSIKENDIETILEVLEEENIQENNKEVKQKSEQVDGSWLMIVVFIALMIILLVMFI
jgi:hypothetical protein